MKEIIIAFVLALSISCAIGGFQNAKKPLAVGISNAQVKDAAISTEKKDIMVGELQMVNVAKTSRAATSVKETGCSDCIDFPKWGSFH